MELSSIDSESRGHLERWASACGLAARARDDAERMECDLCGGAEHGARLVLDRRENIRDLA
jgi:hypothetical protein